MIKIIPCHDGRRPAIGLDEALGRLAVDLDVVTLEVPR